MAQEDAKNPRAAGPGQVDPIPTASSPTGTAARSRSGMDFSSMRGRW